MTDVVHNTGSALLDHLVAERHRIRDVMGRGWTGPAKPVVVKFAPPPAQQEPCLKERLAQAMRLQGSISEKELHAIRDAIHASARDHGEYVAKIAEPLPEIETPGVPTIFKIQTVVAEHYGLTRVELLSQQRVRRIVIPRHIAMYLCKQLIPHGCRYICRRFGRLDHSSVRHAVRKIEFLAYGGPQHKRRPFRRTSLDDELAAEIELLRGLLRE